MRLRNLCGKNWIIRTDAERARLRAVQVYLPRASSSASCRRRRRSVDRASVHNFMRQILRAGPARLRACVRACQRIVPSIANDDRRALKSFAQPGIPASICASLHFRLLSKEIRPHSRRATTAGPNGRRIAEPTIQQQKNRPLCLMLHMSAHTGRKMPVAMARTRTNTRIHKYLRRGGLWQRMEVRVTVHHHGRGWPTSAPKTLSVQNERVCVCVYLMGYPGHQFRFMAL